MPEEQVDERDEDARRYFRTLKENPNVTRLQAELGIKDDKMPSFAEIYDDVDRLLSNAPVSIKRAVDRSMASGNTRFNPL